MTFSLIENDLFVSYIMMLSLFPMVMFLKFLSIPITFSGLIFGTSFLIEIENGFGVIVKEQTSIPYFESSAKVCLI
jgi:hypothetical protein